MHSSTPTLRDRIHAVLAVACLLAGSSEIAGAAPGEPDVTFGNGGVLFLDSGNDHVDRMHGLLADGAGGFWATGAMTLSAQGLNDLALVHLLPDGSLDPQFGDNGITGIDTGGISDSGAAIARQADGKLLVAGTLNSGAYRDWGLARFHADGSLDTSFGEDAGNGTRRGYVRVNVAPDTATNEGAVDLAIQSDGRIVVAGVGYAFDGAFKYARFAMLRFTVDGALDTSFGSNGVVLAPAQLFQTGEVVTTIARHADGRLPADDSITLVGAIEKGNGALIRRYLADGAVDTAYGSNGFVRITDTVSNSVRTGLAWASGGALQSDGRLVVAGSANDRGFTFVRLLADGSRDASFGSNGRTLVKFSGSVDYDEPAALIVHADDRIAASGFATGVNQMQKSEDFAAVQLLANGQVDTEFGDGAGRVRYPLSLRRDEAFALAATPTGGLLLAGTSFDESSQSNNFAAFARLRGNDLLFRDGFE